MKVVTKLNERDIKTEKIENLEEIVGINNCKIVGIKNKNLSEIILNLIH